MDVPAVEGRLNTPFGIDRDPQGNLVLVEYKGGRVLRIDPKGMLTLLAGCGRAGFSGDGGPPQAAEFNAMHSLAISPTGLVYLADTLNHRVRVLDIERGRLSTFAGYGPPGFSGDGGQAIDAQFNGIYCLALNPSGDQLYLADLENRRIRAIDLKSGIVRTVAGNGKRGVPDDGAMAIKHRWSIRGRSLPMPTATSISWNAAGTPCGWSMPAGGFVPWPAPAKEGRAPTSHRRSSHL